jgi:hypothetical protein
MVERLVRPGGIDAITRYRRGSTKLTSAEGENEAMGRSRSIIDRR